MIVAIFFISFLYVTLLLFLIKGIGKLKPFVLESLPNKTRFSVIVPFRDEANNLENLLQSFCQLDYPETQFEIILVNDFSSDNYKPIIAKFKSSLPNLRCIEAVESDMAPKKAALTLGISKAKFDWILTTDADCSVPKNWLKAYNQKIINDAALFIAGLVKFKPSKSFLNRFQCLDLLSLQATLLGTFGLKKPMLCHGANLCYAKSLFYELNGFKNHQNIASGDDVFLLEAAFKKYPKKVSVLNSLEAVVTTNSEPNLKALLSQRTRWAAKATAYKNNNIKVVGLVVFTTNLLLLSLTILSVLGLFNVNYILLTFLIKFNIDALILYPTARFFKQESVLKSYVLSGLLYPLFSVTSVFLGFTKGYTWKERKFKK
ncbi:MAG: glycosyltransferase [Flavobacteriaceae bacterium]|nr:glycosyltransferase [Flavobacteriaceae bacterium]